jgi:hypothetical protein
MAEKENAGNTYHRTTKGSMMSRSFRSQLDNAEENEVWASIESLFSCRHNWIALHPK